MSFQTAGGENQAEEKFISTNAGPTRQMVGESGLGLSFFTIIPLFFIAAILFGVASYPTVEGWGLWCNWNEEGVEHYTLNLQDHADRPLHLVPSLLAWLMPGDFGIGSMLVGGMLAVIRGWLVWMLTRLSGMNAGFGFVVVVMGLFQPIWRGCGYERFQAGQTAFVCLLAALNMGIWHSHSRAGWKIGLGILLNLAGFLTYQGLFLVAACVPIAFLICVKDDQAKSTCMVFASSCFLYVCWFILAAVLLPAGYVGKHSGEMPAGNIFNNLLAALRHCGPLAIISMGLALAFCFLGAGQKEDSRGIKNHIFLWAVSPLFGLIFFRNPFWLRDPDRVFLPVMAWVVVILVAIGGPASPNQRVGRWNRVFAVGLVVCGLLSTAGAIYFVQLQTRVLLALEKVELNCSQGETVVVVDRTHELGMLYTFLAPDHLSMAWHAKGHMGNLRVENRRNISGAGSQARRVVVEKWPSGLFWRNHWVARLETRPAE